MGILVLLKELQTFKSFFFEKKKQETFYFWADAPEMRSVVDSG